jgi:hypothetical protein
MCTRLIESVASRYIRINQKRIVNCAYIKFNHFNISNTNVKEMPCEFRSIYPIPGKNDSEHVA